MQSLKVKVLSAVAIAAFVMALPVTSMASGAVVGGLHSGNAENGKKIFNEGKGDVPACNSCHGMTGMGDDAMGTPRLAGQGFTYIVKQLEDFASDRRTDTTMFVMNANSKGLSAQDRKDVAAYVYHLGGGEGSDLMAVKELGQPVGKSHLGKALVIYGAPERGIPSCYACHQYNGRGAFPVYPQIGGQKYVYLVNQLMKWRDGSRANDPMAQMRKVAQKLSDDDIHNLAAYLTNAPKTTQGNATIPAEIMP